MAIRPQELHPAAVHLPIALLPVALAADAVGTLSRDHSLREMGRRGILIAAGGSLVAAGTGLLAQVVNTFDEESRAILVKHRTANLGVVGLLVGMAIYRSRHRSAGPGYFAAGAASVGLAVYSAWLGGEMVYGHGVGVEAKSGSRITELRIPDSRLADSKSTASPRRRKSVIRNPSFVIRNS